MSNLAQSGIFMGLTGSHVRADETGKPVGLIQSVPYDQHSSYGLGSDKGPKAIIEASEQVELFDAQLGMEPFRLWDSFITGEPLCVLDGDGSFIDGQTLSDRLEHATLAALKQNQFVVTLGGEHTSIVGAALAHCRLGEQRKKPVTVVQFDAHSDLREEFFDCSWSHACAMARILDHTSSLVQVGIRSEGIEEHERSEREQIPVFYAHEIPREDSPLFEPWLERLIESIKTESIYVTFDCDALDPSIMPSTGTPEPGGLNWAQTNRILKALSFRKEVVGLDINELAPIDGLSAPQFTMAKLLYRWLAWIAMSKKDRQNR